MKQFDVFPNPSPRARDRQPFLVILQSDRLSRNVDTTVVAPLELASGGKYVDRLNPRVEVNGTAFVLIAQELTTVRKAALGQALSSIARDRSAIISALDLLLTGV